MHTLILLRHGEAEPKAASGRDLDRRLTARGRGDAALAGRALASADLALGAVLVSPAVRTQETWAAARAAFDDPPEETEARALYDAAPARLIAVAEACGVGAVLMVAHNPGLPALADLLTGDPRLAAGFPPASFAVLRLDTPGAPWRLADLHRPAGAPA